MQQPITRLVVFLGILLAFLSIVSAQATTFVMMSDDALVDHAPAILEGRIVSVDSSPAPGLPSTDYAVEVDRVLKGSLPGSTLIVRVPGGAGPDGLGFHVYGAPRFTAGDRVLLFVSPADDGTFAPYQLMLGAFIERQAFGERFAVRWLAEAREVEIPGRERTEEERRRARGPRKAEALAAWIVDRVRGRHREPDYFLGPAQGSNGLRNQAEEFTLFLDPVDGEKIRWFLFEEGGTAFFRIHQDGQSGLTLQQLETAVRRGLNAWSTVPGTDIRYDFAGTTTATGGLRDFPIGADGVNAVVAEDPNSSPRFGGPFVCGSGGTLAIGGPWYITVPEPGPNGELFHRTAEGDVVTNKNIGCFFEDSVDTQAAADELFTHELGHTLGIGHSCGDAGSGACDTALKNEAIMRAFVHDDGRGARLNDDDRAAARALYASDNTGGPGEPPMPMELLPPEDLAAAAASETEVALSWTDTNEDETGFAVEMRSAQTGAFQVVRTVGADTEGVTITELDPATPYTFQVTATRDEEVSDPSEEASATTRDPVEGPCAADEHTFCLIDGRFRVRSQWRDVVSGDFGLGNAIEVPGSDLTGLFWFFDEANIELVVKTLDARVVNSHFWNFYGALSSVEYWITVTDTDNGESVTYHNPQNEICGFPDTRAFERPLPSAARSAVRKLPAAGITQGPSSGTTSGIVAGTTNGTTTDCVPSETTLCLLENRFRVEVEWDNSARSGEEGDRGLGRVRPVTTVETDETGFFWFFDPENVELVVKVLDARVLNDHFWVFYGALSDVAYRITVTDTESGDFLTFDNDLGDFCGDADTASL